MNIENKISVFIVDDDVLFLRLLENEFLQDDNFAIRTYATGELCLEHLSLCPDAIILDYHLDGIDKNAMNGIDTLDKIKHFNAGIPVVMLSSQDNIEEAINCISHKALDYVVKGPLVVNRLKKIISTTCVTREWSRLKAEV